jgi:beta-glucosidase
MNAPVRALSAARESSDRETAYKAFVDLMTLAEKPVGWSYEVWDQMVSDLSHRDGHKRALEHARATSIAGGDPLEDLTNRSYRGKTATSVNASDLALIRDTRKAMAGKPVIVSVALSNPMVFRELEKEADAILVTFGVQDQAVLDVLSGAVEPKGLLPLQMPADMRTVEEQQEDVPRDMKCHVDSEGHNYDFGFGLSWSGVIDDARTARYAR